MNRDRFFSGILAAGLCIMLCGRAGAERLFIIDDDVGMLKEGVRDAGPYHMQWAPITDPDGGLEVIYALREPSIQVLGITCTMGCSSMEVCMNSVDKIKGLLGEEDVPVLKGAESPEQLGEPTDAALFIINQVMSNPGEVEIVATAPLTNIATAVMLEPCLPMNWKALHVGTGEFMGALGEQSDAYHFRYLGYEDMNINVDPEAAAYLLERGGDFFIYPNEVMDDASFTPAHLRGLRDAGTPLSSWIADEIKTQLWLGAVFGRLAGYKGLYLHGVIPLAVAIDPGLARPPQELKVQMEQRKQGGHVFAKSVEPETPARPVYVQLANPEVIEERLLQRCVQ